MSVSVEALAIAPEHAVGGGVEAHAEADAACLLHGHKQLPGQADGVHAGEPAHVEVTPRHLAAEGHRVLRWVVEHAVGEEQAVGADLSGGVFDLVHGEGDRFEAGTFRVGGLLAVDAGEVAAALALDGHAYAFRQVLGAVQEVEGGGRSASEVVDLRWVVDHHLAVGAVTGAGDRTR